MGAHMGQMGNSAILLPTHLDMDSKMKAKTSKLAMQNITHAILAMAIEHGPLPSYGIARRIGIDAKQCSRFISKLYHTGRMSRVRVEGKTFWHYFTTDAQRNKHLRETTSQNLTAPLEDIPQRLRFLNGLWQKSPHRGHPVLAAIIKDYERTLRALRKDGDDA